MGVCVYRASSQRIDPAYFAAAEELANAFVQHGVTAVTGGGSYGLMGRLADDVGAGRQGRRHNA